MTVPNAQFQGFQPQGLWPTQEGLFLGGAAGQGLRRIQCGAVTFDTPSVAAASVEEDPITITGLSVDDLVLFSDQTFTANVLQSAAGRVSAADTVQLRSANTSAGALDPVSKVFLFIAFRVR